MHCIVMFVDEPVLLEEGGESLVPPHPQHVLAMSEHIEGAPEPAHHAHQGEHQQLLTTEGIIIYGVI